VLSWCDEQRQLVAKEKKGGVHCHSPYSGVLSLSRPPERYYARSAIARQARVVQVEQVQKNVVNRQERAEIEALKVTIEKVSPVPAACMSASGQSLALVLSMLEASHCRGVTY
jgi:hypothetical protein